MHQAAADPGSMTQAQGWRAHLRLGFHARRGTTVLAERRHVGPLMVQRPFYPEGAPCHVYLIHPPGGVVGGDRLRLEVEVGEAAHAVITTPAANKFYLSDQHKASMEQLLRVDEGAQLEWLPQETIYFDGADVDSITRIDLKSDARFIGWEIACFGRPAAQEDFNNGRLSQRLQLMRDGRPVFLDRLRTAPGASLLHSAWGLQGCSVSGTMLLSGCDDDHLQAARTALAQIECANVSVTRLDDLLLCRYLGHHGEEAKAVFTRVWQALRPMLLGIKACRPRIWDT